MTAESSEELAVRGPEFLWTDLGFKSLLMSVDEGFLSVLAKYIEMIAR